MVVSSILEKNVVDGLLEKIGYELLTELCVIVLRLVLYDGKAESWPTSITTSTVMTTLQKKKSLVLTKFVLVGMSH